MQRLLLRHVRNLSAEMPGATNFYSLPSGNSLRDAMKYLICKKYAKRKGAKKTYDEVMDAWVDVPTGWWLSHNTIVFLLSLMVHRQSPAITTAATEAPAGPKREMQRAANAEGIARDRRVESNKRHATSTKQQQTLVEQHWKIRTRLREWRG